MLDGVSEHMPALALAQKVLGKAAPLGIRPPARHAAGTETRDVHHGLGAPTVSRAEGTAAEPSPETEAELGDALLALVGVARERGWDAERALRERIRVLQDEVRAVEGG